MVEIAFDLECVCSSMSAEVAELDDVVVMVVGTFSLLVLTLGPTPCRSIETICLRSIGIAGGVDFGLCVSSAC